MQIGIFVTAVVLGNAWITRDLPQGKAAPFQISDLQGQIHNIHFSAQKPILLHFFATWCPICELENDAINSISNDYPVILIAMQSGSSNEIQQYQTKHELRPTIYNDASGTISRLYNVKGVPTSFIIDSNGFIRSSVVGFTTEIGLRLRLWWYALNI